MRSPTRPMPLRDIQLVPFAMTARRRRDVAPVQRLPIPARPMRRLWERSELAPITWWTGPLDLAHGTNYVVPPAPCACLVSIHDLTVIRFPEMCTPDVRRLPGLLRRVIDTGARVHTDSRFVADEVVELLGAERSHVHTIPLGIPADPAALAAAAAHQHPYGGRPYLLALGTVEPRKSYPLLVRAFQGVADAHPDMQLVIAGGDGWGSDQLAYAIARLAPELAAPCAPRRGPRRRPPRHPPRGCARLRLPEPLRGVRVPASRGDAGRASCGGHRCRARCPRSWATPRRSFRATTSRPSRKCSSWCRCGRRATRRSCCPWIGAKVLDDWRTTARGILRPLPRDAGAGQVRVAIVAEQLRRERPGGNRYLHVRAWRGPGDGVGSRRAVARVRPCTPTRCGGSPRCRHRTFPT